MVDEDLGEVLNKIEQGSPLEWKDRGNGLAKQGKYEEALTCYNSGLEIDPDNTDIWHNKSLILVKVGRIEESKQCQDKIKEIQNKPQTEVKKEIVDKIQPKIKKFCSYCVTELENPEAEICPICGFHLKQLSKGNVVPASPQPEIIERKEEINQRIQTSLNSPENLKTGNKYCRHCGTQLNSTGATFCSRCGINLKDSIKVSPLINEPTVQTVTPPIIPVTPQTTYPPKKYCQYCRSELMFSEAEICPNCGMRLKEPASQYGNKSTIVYESNYILVGLFFLWFIIWFIGMTSIYLLIAAFIANLLIIIISTIIVYMDAKSLNAGKKSSKVQTTNSVTWRPLEWAILVLLFWIIILPFYLIKRRDIHEQNR